MVKYKAKNSLKSPRFSGIKTFMRMENVETTDDIDFGIFDVCSGVDYGDIGSVPVYIV